MRYDQEKDLTRKSHQAPSPDEADEMLSRGFKDQIHDVYRYLPPKLQVCSSVHAEMRQGLAALTCPSSKTLNLNLMVLEVDTAAQDQAGLLHNCAPEEERASSAVFTLPPLAPGCWLYRYQHLGWFEIVHKRVIDLVSSLDLIRQITIERLRRQQPAVIMKGAKDLRLWLGPVRMTTKVLNTTTGRPLVVQGHVHTMLMAKDWQV